MQDTPDELGDAGQVCLVNDSRTLLEFGTLSFTSLNDTPDSIEIGKYLRGSQDGSNINWTELPHVSGGIVARKTNPTDLSEFVNGQIIAVNTPAPGVFREVKGADSGEQHGFSIDMQASPANPEQSTWLMGTDLNYGYSSFGTTYGNLYTEDRGLPLTASDTPIMRLEVEVEVTSVPSGADHSFGFSDNVTMLIRKTDLTSAPNTIFIRFYTGIPGSTNQVGTVEMTKGVDNPSHDYYTYINKVGTPLPTGNRDILGIKYFRLFTSSPATGDQTSQPLNLHEAKSLVDFSAVPATWARVGQTRPAGSTGGADYTADEADTAKL